MHLQLRRVCFLLLGMWGFSTAWAQEVLMGDQGLPHRTAPSPERQAGGLAPLRTTTLTLPFFDDFSYESAQPDTQLWAIHPTDSRRPGVSISKGQNPRSKGVATFDGATFTGIKYDATFGAGLTDTLASQPIDLSGLSPNDSVYLSFFVERGGAGESPESSDSIVVLFDTTGNYDYTQVWALPGLGASESKFQLYFVPLDSARYFHSAFRFKFEAYGSLNGELDQFHLDYVVLDAQRSRLDSVFNDQSAIRFTRSPMYPYSAMPRKHFQRIQAMTDTRAEVATAGINPANVSLSLAIDDPVGLNVFAGTTLVSSGSASLSSFGNDTVNGAAFSDQSSQLIQYGSIRLTGTRIGSADGHSANDTIRTIFPIDSTLGMDDGVSDFGYGLTAARAFCQEFHIDQPDTLVAVWIHFAPSIHYNQVVNVSTDLQGKAFRLVIWDSLSVDSSLAEVSGGMNVAYGTELNQFTRYQLISPVIVPDTFWVGIRQTDGMAIGMGFDRNESVRRIYFENANSEFQLSTNRGTLMIRPEFKGPAPAVGVENPREAYALAVAVAPNPVRGGQIHLQVREARDLQRMNCSLVDVQGRVLQAWEGLQPRAEMNLEIAQPHASGIYWLQMRATDRNGRVRQHTEKLIYSQE